MSASLKVAGRSAGAAAVLKASMACSGGSPALPLRVSARGGAPRPHCTSPLKRTRTSAIEPRLAAADASPGVACRLDVGPVQVPGHVFLLRAAPVQIVR